MSGVASALVTGASGFIGSRLCEALNAEGVRVVALMRSQVDGSWERYITADLETDTLVPGCLDGIDTVFHLAGTAHALAETGEYERINVQGTRKVLDAAVRDGVRRFVFFSSVKAMGGGGDNCLDESCTLPPDSPYGSSKRQAEGFVLEAGADNALHVVVLRLSLVYGPGVKGNLAVMLDAISRERFPPLAITHNRRSMVHVDDVVRAAIAVATAPSAAGQTYILTDGEAYSTTAIYWQMSEVLGKRVPRWHVPVWLLTLAALFGDLYQRVRGRRFVIDSQALQRLTGSAWYSSEKIERELAVVASTRLAQALPEMVSYAKGRGE